MMRGKGLFVDAEGQIEGSALPFVGGRSEAFSGTFTISSRQNGVDRRNRRGDWDARASFCGHPGFDAAAERKMSSRSGSGPPTRLVEPGFFTWPETPKEHARTARSVEGNLLES